METTSPSGMAHQLFVVLALVLGTGIVLFPILSPLL